MLGRLTTFHCGINNMTEFDIARNFAVVANEGEALVGEEARQIELTRRVLARNQVKYTSYENGRLLAEETIDPKDLDLTLVSSPDLSLPVIGVARTGAITQTGTIVDWLGATAKFKGPQVDDGVFIGAEREASIRIVSLDRINYDSLGKPVDKTSDLFYFKKGEVSHSFVADAEGNLNNCPPVEPQAIVYLAQGLELRRPDGQEHIRRFVLPKTAVDKAGDLPLR